MGMRRLTPFLISLGLLTSLAQAETVSWIGSYELGLKKASQEKKDLLLVLTGSDWCAKCQSLEATVLTQQAFLEKAATDFVLVSIDFPQLNAELSKRNDPVRVQYGVRSLPTFVVTDSTGRPYGEVSYHAAWKEEDYLSAITALGAQKSSRDQAAEILQKATDPAIKAAALEKMLQAVPVNAIPQVYHAELLQLRKLSNGKSPLFQAIADRQELVQMKDELRNLLGQRRFQEVISLSETYLRSEGLETPDRQAGLTIQYFALMETGRFEKALAAAKALNTADPQSPIGVQALGMIQQAEAAFETGSTTESPRAVAAPANPEKVLSEKETAPQANEKVTSSAEYEQSLRALEVSHEVLAAAEKAAALAEADLAAAREKHAKAHQVEAEMRLKAIENQPAAIPASGSVPDPQSESEEGAPPAIEEFEQRADELRRRAAELRKKAEKLRQANPNK